MAKEKVFRSGKKNRKKKFRPTSKKEQKAEWKQWGKQGRRGARNDSREQEAEQPNEILNEEVIVKKYKKKKKKKKTITEDEWNTWNRSRTTGLTRRELQRETEVTLTSYAVLTVIDLGVDLEQVALLKKKKHTTNLVSILDRLP